MKLKFASVIIVAIFFGLFAAITQAQTFPPGTGSLSVSVGTTLTLEAFVNPTGAPAWPQGEPRWMLLKPGATTAESVGTPGRSRLDYGPIDQPGDWIFTAYCGNSSLSVVAHAAYKAQLKLSVEGVPEAYKDIAGDDAHPGKAVPVNDGDEDGDGVPSWLDGFSWINHPAFATSSDGVFTRIMVSISGALDFSKAKLKFDYDASNPANITYVGDQLTPDPNGRIRIWTKNNGGSRNKNGVLNGGDFVAPGIYNASLLGLSNEQRAVTFFVEAVRESAATADTRIVVSVDPNDSPEFTATASDAVRFTAGRIEITAQNYRRDQSFVAGSRLAISQTPITVLPSGLLRGSYLEYTLHIHDPRSTLRTAAVDRKGFVLTPAQNGYSTEAWMLVDQNVSAGVGSQVSRIPVNADEFLIRYNQEFRKKGFKTTSPASDDAFLAKASKKVTENMERSWQPTNPADKSEFGKEFHRLMTKEVRGNRKFQADFYVVIDEMHPDYGMILEPQPGGGQPKNYLSTQLQQVDAVKLKGAPLRYNVAGEWSADKIERLVDFKTGSRNLAQEARLKNLIGGRDIDIVRPSKVYRVNATTGAGEFMPLKRVGQVAMVLGILGLAETAYNLVTPSRFDDEFDAIRQQIDVTLRTEPDSPHRPFEEMKLIQLMNGYLSHFLVNPNQQVLNLLQIEAIFLRNGGGAWINQGVEEEDAGD